MKKSLLLAVMVAAGSLLSGCVTLTIDERTAFAPPKRDVGPALDIGELNHRMGERLKLAADQGLLRFEQNSAGTFRVAFREDSPRRLPVQPSALQLRNGFIGEGGGRVAWTLYTPAAGLMRADERPLVVHCAGNASDRYNSGINYAVKALPWADVLVFDYPGYGDTPGPASAATFEAAASALRTYVSSLAADRKLVFWGQSLGGFVCARLASDMPQTDGLILETTAPSAAAVAKAWTPNYARLFVRASVAPSLARYDVIAAAAQIDGPVLVLGAAKDNVLPVSLAREIADGLRSRNASLTYKEFPDAKHMNVPDQAGFNEVVAAFFKTVESQP
jgi:pimeloyl-ACP methyl ester carboxylesterase